MEEFPGYLLPLPNFIKWAYSGAKRKNFEYTIVPAVKYCQILSYQIASVVQSVEEEAQDRYERDSDLDLEVVISRNIISKKRSKKASFISEDVEEDTLSEEEEKNFAPVA